MRVVRGTLVAVLAVLSALAGGTSRTVRAQDDRVFQPFDGRLGDKLAPLVNTEPRVSFGIEANLNANAPVDDPLTPARDEAASLATGVAVALGPRTLWLDLVFAPLDRDGDRRPDAFAYEVRIERDTLAAPPPGAPWWVVIDEGELLFDADGQLVVPPASFSLVVPRLADGLPATTLWWDLYDRAGHGLITRRTAPYEVTASFTAVNGQKVRTRGL